MTSAALPKGASGTIPDRLQVAAIQMKFAPTIDGNLAKIETLLDKAARRRTDVVLLPECATTGYAYDFARLTGAEVRTALGQVGAMAARRKMNVLVGSPVFRRGKLYNCLVVFDRQGRAVHCYAKCHLHELDRKHFTPGNAVALFGIDGVAATTVICHERRYPELVRLAVMAGARILFHPNAGMDALKTTEVGGEERSYDGGKKIKGRKRHLLVDTLGLLVVVLITGAGLDDGAAAPKLLHQITPEDFPRLAVIFGDNKYHNHALEAWLNEERPNWRIEVKTRPEGTRGFTPLEKRWVVERTNAWNGRCRRNSKDYERRIASSAAMIQISNIHLMLRRLAPGSQPTFHYHAAA